jgi:hypothetical protein
MEERRWKQNFTAESQRAQRESIFSLPGDAGNEKPPHRFAKKNGRRPSGIF